MYATSPTHICHATPLMTPELRQFPLPTMQVMSAPSTPAATIGHSEFVGPSELPVANSAASVPSEARPQKAPPPLKGEQLEARVAVLKQGLAQNISQLSDLFKQCKRARR